MKWLALLLFGGLMATGVVSLDYTEISDNARCTQSECQLYSYQRFYNNGSWQEWDFAIQQTGCPRGATFCTKNNPFNLLANRTTSIVTSSSEELSFFPEAIVIGSTPVSFSTSTIAAEGNILKYQSFLPDSWFEIAYTPEGIEHSLVLNSTSFLRTFPNADNLTFSFALTQTNQNRRPSPIVVYDKRGRVLRFPISVGNGQASFTIPLSNLTRLRPPIVIDPQIVLFGNNNTYDGEILEDFTIDDTSQTMRAGVFCDFESLQNIKVRSFIDWNLSIIPDNALIKSVNFTIIFLQGDEFALNITNMDSRAQGRSGTTLYNDIAGTAYGRYTYAGSGSLSMILNQAANDTIQGNLTGTDFFSLGVTTDQLSNACGLFGDDATDISTRENTDVGARPQLRLTFNRAPTATLHIPVNNTKFTLPSILINFTLLDDDNDRITSRLYASPSAFPENTYLLHYAIDKTNGTNLQYNLTALPIQNQSRMLYILHMDNNTDFFEPQGLRFYDFTGNNHNFTAIGSQMTQQNTGKFGAGLEPLKAIIADRSFFTGTARSFVFIENTTLSMWYNVSSVCNPDNADNFFYSQQFSGTGFGITLSDCQNVKVITDGSTDTFFGFVPTSHDDQWHHLGFALRMNGTYDLYRDGVLINWTESATTITDNFAATYIGTIIGADNSFFAYQNFFQGQLDDVAVINRTLNATEIRDIARIKDGVYYWYANMTDGSIYKDQGRSEIRQFCLNVTNCDLDTEWEIAVMTALIGVPIYLAYLSYAFLGRRRKSDDDSDYDDYDTDDEEDE